MVHSVILCSFATICTTIVPDGSLKLYELETALHSFESSLRVLKVDAKYYKNHAHSANFYKFSEARGEAITKVIAQSLDNVKGHMLEALSHGKNASSCFEQAAVQAAEHGVKAFEESEPCLETVVHAWDDVKTKLDNITAEMDKAVADIGKVSLACSNQSYAVTPLENCVEQHAKHLASVVTALKDDNLNLMHDGNKVLRNAMDESKHCLKNVSADLTSNLKPVEDNAEQCINAL